MATIPHNTQRLVQYKQLSMQIKTYSLTIATCFTLIVGSSAFFWGSSNKCPDMSEKVVDLNLEEYLRASWYVQEQQIVDYQPVESNYCVSASYNIDDKSKLRFSFFSGTVVSVYNYGNTGGVNGKAANDFTTDDALVLCARVPDAKQPGKLLVAPCFLPNWLAGDYWVIAAGPSRDNYEWAIVSGGNPTVEYADGCTTKTKGTNGAGLWLFTRDPNPDPKVVQHMRDILVDYGYSLQELNKVTQTGCKYEGHYVKPNVPALPSPALNSAQTIGGIALQQEAIQSSKEDASQIQDAAASEAGGSSSVLVVVGASVGAAVLLIGGVLVAALKMRKMGSRQEQQGKDAMVTEPPSDML